MKALPILLIPLKLLIKLIGYLFVAVLKIIGWFITVMGMICGVVTGIIGFISVILGAGYLIFGFMGAGNLNTMDHWWVSGLICCVFGAILFSMGLWVAYVGAFISEIGTGISDFLGNIELLPKK